ncbi:hypothetical protein GNI_015490 [Gregarina niphandrodes]|uniref:Uncharacterized protein n=1 Tax=Gregarina niphandrodes TaxID=110365 RepID=A0A023BC99_GRENI|nr:hypothetical protein GNI_015490 [Gregarina niphandrodes]EZG83062.1 hypothetical protein GNI_015490 [Gregarina niphandrodes]|eukprot:XP_011128966.1 hypothetical protein GNI_015490 [Gregarina niphandrodes]
MSTHNMAAHIGTNTGWSNWVNIEPDHYYNHDAALRDAEHLLCTVASFCSMSNETEHLRVSPCATMSDEDVALTGAALVSDVFRNAPEMHAYYIVGLCCAHPTAIGSHSTYKLKLGVLEIYQNQSIWDFRYGWERSFGHIQTTIDGELIDNGFIQRLANVMDWETFGKIRTKRSLPDHEAHGIKKLRYQPVDDFIKMTITFCN